MNYNINHINNRNIILKAFILLLIVIYLSVFSLSFISVSSSSNEPCFIKFYRLDKEFISFFKTKILAPYLAVFINTNLLPGFNDSNNTPMPLKKPTKKEGVSKLLLSFFHISLMIDWRVLLTLLLTLSAMIAAFSVRKRSFGKKQRVYLNRYFSIWILKFINPLQKYLNNRSNEYDIEKDNYFLWGNDPHFESFIRSAGFFYAYKVRLIPANNTIKSHNEVKKS